MPKEDSGNKKKMFPDDQTFPLPPQNYKHVLLIENVLVYL